MLAICVPNVVLPVFVDDDAAVVESVDLKWSTVLHKTNTHFIACLQDVLVQVQPWQLLSSRAHLVLDDETGYSRGYSRGHNRTAIHLATLYAHQQCVFLIFNISQFSALKK